MNWSMFLPVIFVLSTKSLSSEGPTNVFVKLLSILLVTLVLVFHIKLNKLIDEVANRKTNEQTN